MPQAVFGRVGLNIGRARARRGWITALGAGRFGRVFRVWVWMLVTRLLGLRMVGRHRATFRVSRHPLEVVQRATVACIFAKHRKERPSA